MRSNSTMFSSFNSQPTPASNTSPINWADVKDNDGLELRIESGNLTQVFAPVSTSNQPGSVKPNKPNRGPRSKKSRTETPADRPQGKKAPVKNRPQGKNVTETPKCSQGYKGSPKKFAAPSQKIVDQIYTNGYSNAVPSNIRSGNLMIQITIAGDVVAVVAKKGNNFLFAETVNGFKALYNESADGIHKFVALIDKDGSGYCVVVNMVKETAYYNKVIKFVSLCSATQVSSPVPTPSPQANSSTTVHSERSSVKVKFDFVSLRNQTQLNDSEFTVIEGYVVAKYNNVIISVKPSGRGFEITLEKDGRHIAVISKGVRINNNYFVSDKNINGVTAAIAESHGNSGCNAIPLQRLVSNLFYGLGIVPGSNVVLSLPWMWSPHQ